MSRSPGGSLSRKLFRDVYLHTRHSVHTAGGHVTQEGEAGGGAGNPLLYVTGDHGTGYMSAARWLLVVSSSTLPASRCSCGC